MGVKIGINGFGRVGRVVFRTCLENSDVEVCAINDPVVAIDYICYLIKYDSTHRTFRGHISHSEKEIRVNGTKIAVFQEKFPSCVPWQTAGAEYIVEASGVFTDFGKASGHLIRDGVKRVIVAAPSLDVPMVILGVNDTKITPERRVISCGSSTLYCLAPIVKVLEDAYGVEDGFVTSIHAMTPSLKPLDGLCLKGNHWRDHRSITQNIIPTVTGACKALGRIIPAVKDRMAAVAFRVPIPDVSVLDITIRLKKNTSLGQIMKDIQDFSEKTENIIKINTEQVVSSDFIGDSCSCIVDSGTSMQLKPNYYKLVCWYENEYSFACRIIDLIRYSESQIAKAGMKHESNAILTQVYIRPIKKLAETQQMDLALGKTAIVGTAKVENVMTESLKKPQSLRCKGHNDASLKKSSKNFTPVTSKVWNVEERARPSLFSRGHFAPYVINNVISEKPRESLKVVNLCETYVKQDVKNKNTAVNITQINDLCMNTEQQAQKNELINNRKDILKIVDNFETKDSGVSSTSFNAYLLSNDTLSIQNGDNIVHSEVLLRKDHKSDYNLLNSSETEVNADKISFIIPDITKQTVNSQSKWEPNKKIEEPNKNLNVSTSTVYPLEVNTIHESNEEIIIQVCDYVESDKTIHKNKMIPGIFPDNFQSPSCLFNKALITKTAAQIKKTVGEGNSKNNVDESHCTSLNNRVKQSVKSAALYLLKNGLVKGNNAKPKQKSFHITDSIKKKNQVAKQTNNDQSVNNTVNSLKEGREMPNDMNVSKEVLEHKSTDLSTQFNSERVCLNSLNITDNAKIANNKRRSLPTDDKNDDYEKVMGDKDATSSKAEQRADDRFIVNDREARGEGDSQICHECFSNTNHTSFQSRQSCTYNRDIFDKLDSESASTSDSNNSFEIHKKKSHVIKITDLTKSLEDLDRLDKICRIMEISDELSDDLFSSLNNSKVKEDFKKRWSFKEFCENVNFDDFCNKVFGK